MSFVDKILIVDHGNFIYYNEKLDIIVISEQFKTDPELFNYLVEHEYEHRLIHKRWGFWGFLFHAKHDWVSRFKMMFSDYPQFKKIVDLYKFTRFAGIKMVGMRFLYGLLTIPTLLFQYAALSRVFFDWIRDLF